MGPAGFEPASGGLKVDASVSSGLALAAQMSLLSQECLGWVRAFWDPLVDPPLTQFLVFEGNVDVLPAWRQRFERDHDLLAREAHL
jgi:hypothetical protein